MGAMKIRRLWKKYAPQYWWGDPLDVRFHLCEEIAKLHNKNILDVGCNVGIVLNCADNTNQKYGFDLDKKAIKIAQKLKSVQSSNARFEAKDVFKTRFPKEHFDVIILANIIEMFDDPYAFIKRVSFYLKKGGTLYVTTPNGDNPYYRNTKMRYGDICKALRNYDYRIRYWNPFPIHIGHALCFLPGCFTMLRFISKYTNIRRGTAFYIEARRLR